MPSEETIVWYTVEEMMPPRNEEVEMLMKQKSIGSLRGYWNGRTFYMSSLNAGDRRELNISRNLITKDRVLQWAFIPNGGRQKHNSGPAQ